MRATIKPLGMTEAEIQEAEKMGVKWRKDPRRSYIAMRQMPMPADLDIRVLEKNGGRIPEDYNFDNIELIASSFDELLESFVDADEMRNIATMRSGAPCTLKMMQRAISASLASRPGAFC